VEESGRPPSPCVVLAGSADIGLLMEFGRQRRSGIKRLKRSDGPLALQIQAAIEAQRGKLGISSAVEVVPVIFLYRVRESDDGNPDS
jgi:hypothetical protein